MSLLTAPTQADILDLLDDEYFSQLDRDGVSYMCYIERNGYVFGSLMEQYEAVSDDEKAQSLGYRDFAAYLNQKLTAMGIAQPPFVEEWTRAVKGSL